MSSVSPVGARWPLIETVLSAQFLPVSALTSAHLGAFWQELGAEWRNVSEAPALEPHFETFGLPVSWGKLGEVQLRFQSVPTIRLRIRNAHDRLIQIQNGRMMYNWVGSDGTYYSRYKTLKAEFDGIKAKFEDFVSVSGLGTLSYNQWEVTYVNHIIEGTVWSGPQDWHRVVKLVTTSPLASESAIFESLTGSWAFEIPRERGRLHIEIHHGYTAPNGKPLIELKLTARGPISQGTQLTPTLDDGLDLGHATIIDSFLAVTSDEAQSYWKGTS